MARNTLIRVGAVRSFPMGTGVDAEAGEIACLNAAGFCVAGSAAANLNAVGIFEETKSNPGANGAETVKVRRDLNESYAFADAEDAAAIDLSDVGEVAYIDGPSTVRLNATGTSPAGIIDDVDDKGVHIRFTK